MRTTKKLSPNLNKEEHGCSHAEHAAADVDDGRDVQGLLVVALHDAVVDVVGSEVKEEDDEEVIGGSHVSCASPSEVEAERNVDQAVEQEEEESPFGATYL